MNQEPQTLLITLTLFAFGFVILPMAQLGIRQWLDRRDLRERQRIALEAQQPQVTHAQPAPALTGDDPLSAVARSLAALEPLLLSIDRRLAARSSWEQLVTFIAQVAVVVGAVIAVLGFVRR